MLSPRCPYLVPEEREKVGVSGGGGIEIVKKIVAPCAPRVSHSKHQLDKTDWKLCHLEWKNNHRKLCISKF